MCQASRENCHDGLLTTSTFIKHDSICCCRASICNSNRVRYDSIRFCLRLRAEGSKGSILNHQKLTSIRPLSFSNLVYSLIRLGSIRALFSPCPASIVTEARFRVAHCLILHYLPRVPIYIREIPPYRSPGALLYVLAFCIQSIFD